MYLIYHLPYTGIEVYFLFQSDLFMLVLCYHFKMLRKFFYLNGFVISIFSLKVLGRNFAFVDYLNSLQQKSGNLSH